jgi:hypothetical protein
MSLILHLLGNSQSGRLFDNIESRKGTSMGFCRKSHLVVITQFSCSFLRVQNLSPCVNHRLESSLKV